MRNVLKGIRLKRGLGQAALIVVDFLKLSRIFVFNSTNCCFFGGAHESCSPGADVHRLHNGLKIGFPIEQLRRGPKITESRFGEDSNRLKLLRDFGCWLKTPVFQFRNHAIQIR